MLDWFAGQALAGMNANPEIAKLVMGSSNFDVEVFYSARAKGCYAQALAMLEEHQRLMKDSNDRLQTD